MSANPESITGTSHIDLRQRNDRLSLLSDIAGLLLLNDNPREIIDIIFKMLSAHLDLEAYFNYLVVDDGSFMQLYNYGGISDKLAKEIELLEYGHAVCGCVARDRERIVAENVQCSSDTRTDLVRSLGITAYCCHPLIAHGKLIGTLSFGTRNRMKFGDDEIALMQTVCKLVATSLERAKLISNLQSSQIALEEKVKERTSELQEKQEVLEVQAVALEAQTEELRSKNDQLLKQIAERERAEAEALEAKERAELYLDLMGHDISNMHQIAMSQLELAEEIMAESGRLVSDEKELIETPLQTLERSAMLINNVRKLQKLRMGEYSIEILDLGVLLDEVVTENSNIPGTNVIINYPTTKGHYVKANQLLSDVFANLVDNAIKHSGGSVKINIGVSKANDNGRMFSRVIVEDDGPGIPDERKEEIFNRLKRGQTMARGTGLGLYIVKTLVKSYHGHITIEDRVAGDHSKGSRFIVSLPAMENINGS